MFVLVLYHLCGGPYRAALPRTRVADGNGTIGNTGDTGDTSDSADANGFVANTPVTVGRDGRWVASDAMALLLLDLLADLLLALEVLFVHSGSRGAEAGTGGGSGGRSGGGGSGWRSGVGSSSSGGSDCTSWNNCTRRGTRAGCGVCGVGFGGGVGFGCRVGEVGDDGRVELDREGWRRLHLRRRRWLLW